MFLVLTFYQARFFDPFQTCVQEKVAYTGIDVL